MIRNRAVIVLLAFCAFGLLGLLFPAVGASLPAIGDAFAVGIGRAGLILAAFQAAYTLLCLLGGPASDRLGRLPVLAAGALLYAAGAVLLGRPAGFAANLGLFAVMGTGAGLIYIGSNALVIELFPERRGAVLSLHHLTYSAATLAAPLIIQASLRGGRPWSGAYRLFGLAALGLGLLFLLARPPQAARAAAAPGRREYRQMLANRLFLLLLAVGLLAIGVQFGVTYLLVSLLVKARGVPLPRASLVLTLYFLVVTAGRLACGWLVERLGNTRMILGSLVLLAVTLLGGWAGRGPVSLALFALSGLAFSALMPGLLALASAILSRQVMGTALGLVATAAGLGGVIVPALTSALADRVGLDRAFLLIVAVSLAVTAGFFALHGRFLAAERGVPRRQP